MHLLSVDDFSREQINEIFEIADDVSLGKSTISIKEGSVLALLFEEPSTRTRVSFEAAMSKLGGESIYIDTRTSQLSRGESLEDTARVLSLYVDFIVARMHNHNDLLTFANNSTVPVINALTDLEHPTQALADIYTIEDAKKKIKGVRIAFVGDIAQNTANSLMLVATKFGAEMALISPKNYQPNPKYLIRAREYGVVDIYDNLQEGLSNVDIIYTDTFVSMGTEAEAEQRKKMFAKYQINSKSILFAPKNVLVMHPLPAFRGSEITADVLEGSSSIIWEQAKNKMLIAEAIILYLSEKGL
jgi:ornithine carbamoyltransferase